MTQVIRKQPAKRAFVGMAGSPLAKILKQTVQKSDHTLRIPKTPDREDPIPFDVWFDDFGQKHGAIDLDCGFQEYAFDSHNVILRKRDEADSVPPAPAIQGAP